MYVQPFLIWEFNIGHKRTAFIIQLNSFKCNFEGSKRIL